MAFFFISFIAGLLTVLAPCILPLLPVVVGSSAAGRSRLTPFVVVGSLAVSVILFTFVLKASTAFIAIPPYVWNLISGGLLILFGLTLIYPALWESMPGVARISIGSNKIVGQGYQRKGLLGDMMIGAALGPVFSSCSPTYFVILASVLPASFALGTLYLLAYVGGLSLSLLAVALLGQRFADRLSSVSDPKSWVKRGVGVLFILLGFVIVTGLEKKAETELLTNGFFDITRVEQKLLGSAEPVPEAPAGEQLSALEKAARYKQAPELAQADAYLNTGGEQISLAQYRGKKVVLIDFWTYSCINCQRTLPYLKTWYDTYESQGLVIIGIHTPEFAFEHERKNVEEALARFGITYPVLLDNEYQTWNTFGNRFWPRKYLIDIDGYIVYDHAGEGEYDAAEAAIRAALSERSIRLGEEMKPSAAAARLPDTGPKSVLSPETYFGSARNEFLGNATIGEGGPHTYVLPPAAAPNTLYLGGAWNTSPEYAEPSAGSVVRYRYSAKNLYLVAAADTPTAIEVWQDGKLVSGAAGSDVQDGTLIIKESRLYTVIQNETSGEHTLELRVKGEGVRLYTFTFG